MWNNNRCWTWFCHYYNCINFYILWYNFYCISYCSSIIFLFLYWNFITFIKMAIINAMLWVLGSFCQETALIALAQKQLKQIVIRLTMFSRSNWQWVNVGGANSCCAIPFTVIFSVFFDFIFEMHWYLCLRNLSDVFCQITKALSKTKL